MTNAHVEIIEEQKKENKVVVMPVRFLNGEKEINSKSFPFSFETRKKMIESVFGCLLYTSPSPRDKRQSRMPSSA